jgi:zinc transport system substrate-binding protein
MSTRSRLTGRAFAVAAGLVPVVLLGCVGCGGKDSVWPERPGPKVVVSFAPLYCFAANVAGDDAVVKNMMGATGPHDFQPTDTDARLVRHADLFFINGLELDTAKAETLKKGSGNTDLRVVALGDKIPESCLKKGVCYHMLKPGEAPHDHGWDPHVWLGPDQAVIMVEAVRDALKQADPDTSHAPNYDRRAAEYVAKLRKLKADGLDMLREKKDRVIVTQHESLGYFADAFKLNVIGVVQQKPGSEPTRSELDELVKKCLENHARLLAVEPQFSPQAAETLIKELKRGNRIPDAATVEIDPLETCRPDELDAGWYERKMRANLEALARAMK